MKPEVLIVEDDEVFNTVLQRSLSRRGYIAYSAKNLAEAESLIQEKKPRWVVLDLNLDGANSLGLIRFLLDRDAECKIVILTGYASLSTAVDAIKLGAMHYLAKPVDVDTLLRAFDHRPAEAGVTLRPSARDITEISPMSVERLEWEHIQRVLREHHGNISATARALNMHRRTLQRKLMRTPASL